MCNTQWMQILLKIFLKLLIFTRHGKRADPKNTRISFLHETFQETLKIPESEYYTLKIRRALPITLPWKCPPGAKINYSCAEALLFVWLKGCSRQTEVKSRKLKENGIFHLRENDPHSSDEGNPYIKTNLHTGCLRKIANKRGTQIASWAHIYMVFSVVWTGNQQCTGPHCLAIFGTPCIYHW